MSLCLPDTRSRSVLQLMPKATKLFHHEYPLSLLQEGHAVLANSSYGGSPSDGVGLLLAASAYDTIYKPHASKIHSMVRSMGETYITTCELDKASALLQGWLDAALSQHSGSRGGLGVTNAIITLAGTTHQIMGEYAKSRAVRRQCMAICDKQAPPRGSAIDWASCSTCYHANRQYQEAFQLIRDAHRARRIEPDRPYGYNERNVEEGNREPGWVPHCTQTPHLNLAILKLCVLCLL